MQGGRQMDFDETNKYDLKKQRNFKINQTKQTRTTFLLVSNECMNLY
jgi:hypothetical protein